MICPVPDDVLFDYWLADDRDAAPDDALEEHLLSCAACSAASGRVAALFYGLGRTVPPIALADDIALAHARGTRTSANDFVPDVAQEAWLGPADDMLVHRLLGDLSDVTQIDVDLIAPGGHTFAVFRDVPFDPASDAVLIACGRYFVAAFDFADLGVRVNRTHANGSKSTNNYDIVHRVGERPEGIR